MSTPTKKLTDNDARELPELVLSDGASKNPPSDKDWLKATLPVALIAAFAELGIAVINNEFQVYIPKGLGLSAVIMGALTAPFFISEVLFKTPLGVLADRWGRKPLMVLGPAITIFTPLVLASIVYQPHTIVIPVLMLFGFLRLLDGIGAAALWPAMFAYIGDNVSERKRASAMSVLNVTYMLGMALGFLAGGWANDTFGPVLTGEASLRSALQGVYSSIKLDAHHKILALRGIKPVDIDNLQHHGRFHYHILTQAAQAAGISTTIYRPAQYHPSFYLGSVLFALATIVALLTLKDKGSEQRQVAGENGDVSSVCSSEKMTWADFRTAIKSVPHLMFIALITFAGMGCIMVLVKLFALDELGVTETQFGLLILWPAIFIGALAVPLGHVSDKVGSEVSIKVGFCLGAIGMWLLVLLYGSPKTMDIGLLCGAGFLGIGFIIAFPAWMALLTCMGNQAHRGTIVGAVSTAQGVGALIGIGLGPWLYEHGGGVWGDIGHAFGRTFNTSSHISHIAPFAASGILLTVSSLMTILLIKPGKRSECGD